MVQKQILDRVRDSRFCGIMIDKSTDISVACYLVVFTSFVNEGFALCSCLGLLHIEKINKDRCLIFKILIKKHERMETRF